MYGYLQDNIRIMEELRDCIRLPQDLSLKKAAARRTHDHWQMNFLLLIQGYNLAEAASQRPDSRTLRQFQGGPSARISTIFLTLSFTQFRFTISSGII
jgi:hypothetical protein